MKSGPLVSVIVSTHNRADLLCETLDSILSQTYENFELIVVDDGSTDNTEEVVKRHSAGRINYLKIDNWGGPARPRNIGIEKAKGKYIAFCDDDDIWLPKKLEKQINYIVNMKQMIALRIILIKECTMTHIWKVKNQINL